MSANTRHLNCYSLIIYHHMTFLSFTTNQPFSLFIARSLTSSMQLCKATVTGKFIFFSDLIKSRIPSGGNRHWGSGERRSRFNRRWRFTGRTGGYRGIVQGLWALDSKKEYFNDKHLELGIIKTGKKEYFIIAITNITDILYWRSDIISLFTKV